jgi:hypothetical protein
LAAIFVKTFNPYYAPRKNMKK